MWCKYWAEYPGLPRRALGWDLQAPPTADCWGTHFVVGKAHSKIGWGCPVLNLTRVLFLFSHIGGHWQTFGDGKSPGSRGNCSGFSSLKWSWYSLPLLGQGPHADSPHDQAQKVKLISFTNPLRVLATIWVRARSDGEKGGHWPATESPCPYHSKEGISYILSKLLGHSRTMPSDICVGHPTGSGFPCLVLPYFLNQDGGRAGGGAPGLVCNSRRRGSHELGPG